MIEKVISGGQTGVDRAALDAAIELGIPHGGWCPKGRKAEDGKIPAKYLLTETSSAEYRVRTDRNVRDSDGTLVLTMGSLGRGTALTIRLAARRKKPCLVLDLLNSPVPATVSQWTEEHRVGIVNLAGPRESSRPGVYDAALDFLRTALPRRTRPAP